MSADLPTAVEHYLEAERLLNLAHDAADESGTGRDSETGMRRAEFMVARAGVHASLAVAAVVASERMNWTPAPGQNTDGYTYVVPGWEGITRRTPEPEEPSA